jgi:tetratricopeptide (TPR) repeat protein
MMIWNKIIPFAVVETMNSQLKVTVVQRTMGISWRQTQSVPFLNGANMKLSSHPAARLLSLPLLLLFLTACPALPPLPPIAPASGTPATSPTEPAEVIDLADLEATVAASLGITTTTPATNPLGIEGVHAFALENSLDSTPYWVVHTIGLRNFDPLQNHVVALYTRQGERWQAITRLDLADSGDPANPGLAPDYLAEGTVTQVQVEPTHLWIQIQGGAGAHSGVYGLLSFDGTGLTTQVTGFSSSPGNSHLADVDGDGVSEALIDATDYYVFCYACGVRRVGYTLYYWDGAQMTQAVLSPLSADAPAEVQAYNDNLIALAQAGLWKDVLAALPEAALFSYTEPAFQWNLALLRVNGEARQAEATGESPAYPLLDQVFFGDFAAAVDLMRDTGAQAIFSPDSPLIVGTVAENWEPQLADWIFGAVDPTLALNPDLAAAHFLRGWANFLKSGDPAAALADVQQAAELAPDDALYTESAAILGGQ